MCGDSNSFTLELKVNLPPRPTVHTHTVPCTCAVSFYICTVWLPFGMLIYDSTFNCDPNSWRSRGIELGHSVIKQLFEQIWIQKTGLSYSFQVQFQVSGALREIKTDKEEQRENLSWLCRSIVLPGPEQKEAITASIQM